MHDDWLLEVLRDIGDYAQKNDLGWLVPLMDEAYKAARKELNPSAPVPMSWSGAGKSQKSAPVSQANYAQSATVLAFPADHLNSASAQIMGSKGR